MTRVSDNVIFWSVILVLCSLAGGNALGKDVVDSNQGICPSTDSSVSTNASSPECSQSNLRICPSTNLSVTANASAPECSHVLKSNQGLCPSTDLSCTANISFPGCNQGLCPSTNASTTANASSRKRVFSHFVYHTLVKLGRSGLRQNDISYTGRFDMSEEYLDSAMSKGLPFYVVASAWSLVVLVGLATYIFRGVRLYLKRPIHERGWLTTECLASSTFWLSLLALACVLAFNAAENAFYGRASHLVDEVMKGLPQQAKQEVIHVLDQLNAVSHGVLVRENRKLAHSYRWQNKASEELFNHLCTTEMRLLYGTGFWTDYNPEIYQNYHKHARRLQKGLSLFCTIAAGIVVGVEMLIMIARVYNPRWRWPHWPQLKYIIIAGPVLVGGILTAAGLSYALSLVTRDILDAMQAYTSPFNTPFDVNDFIPCSKLSAKGSKAMADVQKALTLNRGLQRNTTFHLQAKYAFHVPPKPVLTLANVSTMLEATVPAITNLTTCVRVINRVHSVSWRNRRYLMSYVNLMWGSLTVLSAALVVLPFLWGLARALKRIDGYEEEMVEVVVEQESEDEEDPWYNPYRGKPWFRPMNLPTGYLIVGPTTRAKTSSGELPPISHQRLPNSHLTLHSVR